MYAFTSQKISLGKDRMVSAITFDTNEDVLAIGFENGGIKLMKFQEEKQEKDENDVQLVMNENLASSHECRIETLSWNYQYGKLLSVDENGLMIVWTESEDTFVEEMVNESDEKRIKFAKWSKNGNFIIIVIEGGGTILGNVEGERLWSKEVGLEIDYLDFIEQDKTIVLSDFKGEMVALDTKTGEIFSEYDVSSEQENESKLLKKNSEVHNQNKTSWRKKSTTHYTQELDHMKKENKTSKNLAVFQGNSLEGESSRLIIGYESGEVYLLHNLRECDMRKFNFGFDELLTGVWRKDGEGFLLSVKLINESLLYLLDKNGVILKCFASPKAIYNLDFNSSGSRLVSGYKNNLYLSKIKKNYKFCFLSKFSVFVFVVELEKQNVFFFYDLKLKNIKKKILPNSEFLISNNYDQFLILTQSFVFKNKYEVFLLNHKGAFLESIVLQIKPKISLLKNRKAIFCSKGHLFIWDFSNLFDLHNIRILQSKSKLYYMNLKDTSKVIDLSSNFDININQEQNYEHDIEAIDISNNNLYLCNEKGFIKRFSLSNFVELTPIMLKVRPMNIYIDKKEKNIAVIDFENRLKILPIKEDSIQKELLSVEEVWAFFWDDQNSHFFYIERNKIYEKDLNQLQKQQNRKKQDLSDEQSGFIVVSDLYFIGLTFPNLILFDIENFERVIKDSNFENFVNFKFSENILMQKIVKIEQKFADHKNLTLDQFNITKKDPLTMKYIADLFLIKNNYKEASKTYRLLNNYSALKFIQRLQEKVQNEQFKQAEKYLFLQQPEKAKKILQENNKENLLIKLLQENKRYKDLLEYNHLLDASTLKMVYQALGEKNEMENHLDQAIKYYEKCGNVEKLIRMYSLTERFDKLADLCQSEKREEILQILAQQLLKVNLVEASAKIYEKIQQPKKSVDISILHNYWGTAVEIAKKNNFQQIENLLNKFASKLLQNNKKMETVQLYRKAKKNLEAARMLNQIAEELIKKNIEALVVKKVFVLSALEINLENKKHFNPNLTANLTNLTLTDQSRTRTLNTLNTLITSDISSIGDKILINPWKGSEAWHLFILGLKYFQTKQFKLGYILSRKLINYELELGVKRVYILGALFSYKIQFFKDFSKNLSKLEDFYSKSKNDIMNNKLQNLIYQIFKNKEPINEDKVVYDQVSCIGNNCKAPLYEYEAFCKSCGANFGICMVSGRNLFSKDYYKCMTSQITLGRDYEEQTDFLCTLSFKN